MDDQARHATTALLGALQRANGYRARREIERLQKRCSSDPRRLEPFGFKVYSQNDEDGIIEEIFRRLGVEAGTFAEIGVENGLECNTLYLAHKGWRGVWLEANAKHGKFIRSKFDSLLGARLQLLIGFVTAENVNDLLEHPDIAVREFDLLSIDIDGNDIHLFRALRCRPKVICIEYNSKWPPNIRKAPVYSQRRWPGTDYMGASLAALTDSAAEKGYRLVATNLTGANAFFVRNDLAGELFADDPSPQNLYNPPRYSLYFDHYAVVGHRADFGPYEDLAR